MKVLIACEESQRSCIEFRKRGHEAYSCDIIPCSGGHPEWHIKGDVIAVINGGGIALQNGMKIDVDRWDLIIAHPPCTYLSNVATRNHSLKTAPINMINARTLSRIDAMQFFMRFVFADCDHIAIENPVGIMNTAYRSPDQIIDPWMFSTGPEDKENYIKKRTCLWLKGLKPLEWDQTIPPANNYDLFGKSPKGIVRNWNDNLVRDPIVRAKTFPGIAKAFAEQWG